MRPAQEPQPTPVSLFTRIARFPSFHRRRELDRHLNGLTNDSPQPLAALGVIDTQIEAGEVIGITITARGWLSHAARLCADLPRLCKLKLTLVRPYVNEVATNGRLTGLTAIDLSENDLNPQEIVSILQAIDGDDLCELELAHNRLDASFVDGLRDSRFGDRLQSLGLAGNSIERCSGRFPELRRLDLSGTGVEIRSLEGLPRLQHLSIGDDSRSWDDVLSMLQRFDGSLDSLDLAGNDLGAIDAISLQKWPRQSLNLARNRLENRTIRRLADAGAFRGLSALDLTANPIGDAGFVAIHGDSGIDPTASLSLANADVGDMAMQWLVAQPMAMRYRELDLSWNRLTDRGLQSLLDSGSLRDCQRLNLSGIPLGMRAVEMLVESPYLDALEMFTLIDCPRLRESGRERLTARFGAKLQIDGVIG